jgi:hypothetical protein
MCLLPLLKEKITLLAFVNTNVRHLISPYPVLLSTTVIASKQQACCECQSQSHRQFHSLQLCGWASTHWARLLQLPAADASHKATFVLANHLYVFTGGH